MEWNHIVKKYYTLWHVILSLPGDDDSTEHSAEISDFRQKIALVQFLAVTKQL